MRDSSQAYWRKNVQILAILLSIWFLVSYLLGIVFVEDLNEYRLGGFPLGFWFAQQGSIVVFVLLILIYALVLNRLDASHHRELERVWADRDPSGGEPSPRAPDLPQAPDPSQASAPPL